MREMGISGICQGLNLSKRNLEHQIYKYLLRLFADSTRARKLLGYEPQISLVEGLQKLKDWYLSTDQSPEVLLENEIIHNWQTREESTHA